LLIMDEPTNHLDMRSKDLLKEALMNYKGALIIVSHDRDFLQGLTSKVFEFTNQGIKPYIGDVYDYISARKIETLDDLNAKKLENVKPEVQAPVKKVAVQEPVLNRDEKKQFDNKKRKVEKNIQAQEDKIADLEKQMAALEKELSAPGDFTRQAEILNDYQKLEATLKKEMAAWETLQTELETIASN